MMPLRKILLATAMAGGLVAVPALAAVQYPYSAGQFAATEAQGKPILVDISASWCPVCQVQKSVIEHAFMTSPAYANFVVFDVDFDTQKNAVRSFHATTQSTLIFFKGGKEVARLVGVTDPNVIDAMLHRTTQ